MFFKIYVGTAKTKDGKEFTTYHTFDKKGVKTNVGFTKEVTNLPRENCIVETNNANVQTNLQFPKLWIKEIITIKPFEKTNKEELLKQFEVNEEDLPF